MYTFYNCAYVYYSTSYKLVSGQKVTKYLLNIFSGIYISFPFRCHKGKNDNYCSGFLQFWIHWRFVQNNGTAHVNENVNQPAKFKVHINKTFTIWNPTGFIQIEKWVYVNILCAYDDFGVKLTRIGFHAIFLIVCNKATIKVFSFCMIWFLANCMKTNSCNLIKFNTNAQLI